ncbi:MAG: protein kinase [archaeon]|nr:protein kinase [archaeon]
MSSNTKKMDISLSDCNIDPKDITIDKELGKGAFGIVYRGKLFGKHVAVKKLINQQMDAETLSAFKKEVAVMSKLRHPNVLLFMGASTEPGNLMIVTELMPRGSIYDLLHQKELELTFKTKIKMAKQAALGMNWLHRSKPPFIHRDLKTSNLLVDENFGVKVCDFGLAHMKTHGNKKQGSYGATGTPKWMAPEVLMNKEYDETADVYSFGIVLWEMVTGQEPFPDCDSYSTLLDRIVTNAERPPVPDSCPAKLKALIRACWDADPKRRPSFDKIIPLFDEIIIDGCIKDPHGRQFWKQAFLKQGHLAESVKWREFVVAFCEYWKAPLPQSASDVKWNCLKAVLGDPNSPETITLEAFGRTLEWFGPMKGINVMDAVESLLRKTWFHGDVSASAAEKAVRGKSPGTFMVRFSAREPGCYSITTVADKGDPKHFRIYHKPGTAYIIGKTEAPTLEAIITTYFKELNLKTPCPGSPFQDIFTGASSQSAVCAYLVPEFDS